MRQKTLAWCLAACLCVWAGLAHAQGLKLGIGISDFEGDDADNWDSRLGWSVGFFMVQPLSYGMGLQTEVLYSTKGAEMSGTVMGQSVKLVTELAYIEIPVLLRVTSRVGSGELAVLLGPFVGFNVSAKTTTTIGGYSQTDNVEDDIADVEAGAVFALAFRGGNVSTELRYSIGLTTTDEGGDKDMRNSVVSVMFGFSF